MENANKHSGNILTQNSHNKQIKNSFKQSENNNNDYIKYEQYKTVSAKEIRNDHPSRNNEDLRTASENRSQQG